MFSVREKRTYSPIYDLPGTAPFSRKGHPGILRQLLVAGADVNAASADGQTALHLVTRKCVTEVKNEDFKRCLHILMGQKGVEVDKKDASGGQGRQTDKVSLQLLLLFFSIFIYRLEEKDSPETWSTQVFILVGNKREMSVLLQYGRTTGK